MLLLFKKNVFCVFLVLISIKNTFELIDIFIGLYNFVKVYVLF